MYDRYTIVDYSTLDSKTTRRMTMHVLVRTNKGNNYVKKTFVRMDNIYFVICSTQGFPEEIQSAEYAHFPYGT